MIRLLVPLLLLVSFVACTLPAAPTATATPVDTGAQCGTERWPVKTMSDKDAGQVDLQPVDSTIQTLRGFVPPATLPAAQRIPPVELQTYRVQGIAGEFKLEDDHDIHVVLEVPGAPTVTMIVELPDVGCQGADISSVEGSIQSARQAFIGICGQPTTSFKTCGKEVDVTGVGFFDFLHGQTGVAPNGIELHPVLAVALDTTPAPTPEPTGTPTVSPAPTPSAVHDVAVGTVVITEMMIDPSAVSDTNGEWFEVLNTSPNTAVDINGWTIQDRGTDSHVINNVGPLVIRPGGYLVLGRNADPATNGGVTVVYQYSGMTLANTGDRLELVDPAGAVIDAVTYGASLVTTGASTSLNPNDLSATANDDPANWCSAKSLLSDGDRGTPGSKNDPC